MVAPHALQLSSLNIIEIPIQVIDAEENKIHEPDVVEFDYSPRGQWLRAAVLGAIDGLVSIASLMMGVGSVKQDIMAMIIVGFAGLVAGACSMAIGEFVSVCTQRDVEIAQMKRGKQKGLPETESGNDEKLPNPVKAAGASALAFAVGAVLPLLAAAFIRQHKVRVAVVAAVASVSLVVFGVVGALLGGTPVAKSSARVLVGGWMAMGTTFGLTKLFGSAHDMQI